MITGSCSPHMFPRNLTGIAERFGRYFVGALIQDCCFSGHPPTKKGTSCKNKLGLEIYKSLTKGEEVHNFNPEVCAAQD